MRAYAAATSTTWLILRWLGGGDQPPMPLPATVGADDTKPLK